MSKVQQPIHHGFILPDNYGKQSMVETIQQLEDGEELLEAEAGPLIMRLDARGLNYVCVQLEKLVKTGGARTSEENPAPRTPPEPEIAEEDMDHTDRMMVRGCGGWRLNRMAC